MYGSNTGLLGGVLIVVRVASNRMKRSCHAGCARRPTVGCCSRAAQLRVECMACAAAPIKPRALFSTLPKGCEPSQSVQNGQTLQSRARTLGQLWSDRIAIVVRWSMLCGGGQYSSASALCCPSLLLLCARRLLTDEVRTKLSL